MSQFDLTPVAVPKVRTRFRTIRTAIPVPQSLPIFEELARSEPRGMAGQPPIVWHRADDFTVSDRWGNRWIDWSSGVLITNAGHGRRPIRRAIKALADRPLLATYVFPHEGRAVLTRMLRELSPDPKRYRVFLLSTGSEAVENCDQAGQDLRAADARSGEKGHRLVPERVSRPDDGGAARRRHGAAQDVARRAGPELRPGAVPRWLQDAGRLVRRVPAGAGTGARRARDDCGCDQRDVPGRRARLHAGRVRARARALLPRARHRAHHGRSAGGLRPQRQDVRLRALRHHARSDRLRQGHYLVSSAVGRDRTRRHPGPLLARIR